AIFLEPPKTLFAFRLWSPSSPFCCSAWLTMPTKLSKARSHSPDSSGQTSCIGDQSQNFSSHHNRHLNYNKPHSISGRPLPERPNVVVQIVLVSPWRRRHEAQTVPDTRGLGPAIAMIIARPGLGRRGRLCRVGK